MGHEKYYWWASDIRDKIKYKNKLDKVLEIYKNNICFYGRYPKAITDDMGDSFIFAKFETLDELLSFDKFVREKEGE